MRKFFLISLLLFFFPTFVLAKNELELKRIDEDLILSTLNQGISDEITKITVLPNVDFQIEKQIILVTLRENIKRKVLNSILKEIEREGFKWILRVASVALAEDPSVIVGEVEKITVGAAKDYAMDWLLQNKVKVGNGNLNFIYRAAGGELEKGFFPYIIAYKPTSLKEGDIAISIYSSNTIKAPEQTLMYQWEGGIEKIPPFILEIKGAVSKTDFGAYVWAKGPEFKFIFDQPVPELDFKEPTWGDQIKEQLNKIGEMAKKTFDAGGEKIVEIIDFTKDAWSKFAGLFGGSAAKAPVLAKKETPSVQITIDLADDLERAKEYLSDLIAELKKPALSLEVKVKENPDKTDELNDLKKEMDILAQKIADLQELAFVLGEAEDKEAEEPAKEPAKETDLKAEPKIQLVVAPVSKKTYSGGGSPAPSYCLPNDSATPLLKVKFYDIGWEGNEDSVNNEWIELRNMTPEEIDLAGWQVLDKDQQIKVIFPNGKIIPPNHIFLMERTDDNSVPDRPADFIYTGALNNKDEILYLFNKDCLLQDSATNMESILEAESEPNQEAFNPPDQETEEPEIPDEEPIKKILINEIAWMGTEASSNDEWIELYNPNEESVDLTGWTFSGINLNFSVLGTATPTIDAFSYLLLERTNDDSVKGTKADHIYTGALNDNGAILELKDDEGNVVDRADFSSGWPAGDKENKVTMERFDENTWKSNNLLVYNSWDAEENFIYGTPRAKNSVVQTGIEINSLPFNKFDEIILPIASSPYYLNYAEITVPENKTLFLEPGVVVKFKTDIPRIAVAGTLKAIGTEEEKITFTSAKENPVPGDWRQIYFKETSVGSEISNVIIEYGGGDPAGTPCSSDMAGIKIENTNVAITNSIIKNNFGRGILLINSNSKIENSEISSNIYCHTDHNDYGGYGIEVRRGTPEIKGSIFKNGEIAIWLDGSYGSAITGNVFDGNKKPISFYNSSALIEENTAENNELNGVFVFGQGEIKQESHWKNNLPYTIFNTMLSIAENAGLTIDAGTIINFNGSYAGIKADGTFIVNGEDGNEVLFTWAKENPVPGSWDKIEITPTSQNSILNYAIIEYAGGGFGTPCSPNMAGLKIKESNAEVNNITIRNTQHSGAYLIDYPLELNNPIFENITKCMDIYGGEDIKIETTVPEIIP
ncbi:MAG: lamin tail domain-containing protein [bacterium]|nr:lamin tail domain-containing protein [bacterium]